MKWSEKGYEQAVLELNTSERNGLTEKEASRRLEIHGLNELTHKNKTSIIIRFARQFNDFMIIVLISAAFISFVVSMLNGERDFVDPIIILMIVMLNAVLGLVQEQKAEKSLEALKKLSQPMSKVLREGRVVKIDTTKIVPGDIIVLETGNMIPADGRLISAVSLKIEESALTGESIAVLKDAEHICEKGASMGDCKNMVYTGTMVSYGRGLAVVCETAMNTEVGKIAHMVLNDEKPLTPLQKKLEETGKILGIGALSICAFIFVMGLMRNIAPFEMFMTSVGLAVAAIPEGLPAIVTIMLAIGVSKMAKENAIIRKLPAVETLGSASVICSDKTGTLTQNKMTVVEVFVNTGGEEKKRETLKYAAMCNDSTLDTTDGQLAILGDPTETALVSAALAQGINKNEVCERLPRVFELPFDSKRKLMTTIHKLESGKYLVITKGAPDVLIERCSNYYNNSGLAVLDRNARKEVLNKNEQMASSALRVLSVATKTIDILPEKADDNSIECGLAFCGLIGMIDPPREEVFAAVQTCKQAGIKPVMVTGDHVITAVAIAKKLGIMGEFDVAMTGEQLNNTDQEELAQNIYKYSVFARVSPEHKVRIVKAFQARGEVVCMTGDGVNDAPALKAADIGCAMGQMGTEVAKSAADMVLTDDNFATIVKAVREGRGIYANIRKAVHFLLSSNIGEIITIFVALLFGWATPLSAIHLLWVNLVTDSLPAIALGLDPVDRDVMKRKPYAGEKSLFSDGLWVTIIFEGLMIGFLALIAYGVGKIYFDADNSAIVGRTMAFATLSISQLVHAFNMRSEKSIFEVGLLTNKYLVWAFFAGLTLQVSVIMFAPLSKIFKVVPLNGFEWAIVAALSFAPLVIVEAQKFVYNKSIKLGKFDYI